MPRYVLEDTPYGNIFGAVRKQQDGHNYVSVTHWILPCFTTPGASPKVLQMNFRVPVDDEHTMHYRLRYDLHDPLSERELWENKHGGFLFPEVLPGTFTPVANKSNDYLIDRLMQRTYSYTGIKSFPIQDLAMIEDQWGPIANRSLEHGELGRGDYSRPPQHLEGRQGLEQRHRTTPGLDTRGGAGGADAYGAASRGGRCRGPATPRASAAVDVPTIALAALTTTPPPCACLQADTAPSETPATCWRNR